MRVSTSDGSYGNPGVNDSDSRTQGDHAADAHGRTYEGTELELFSHAVNWKKYWSSMVRPYIGRRVLDVGAGIGATAACFRDMACERWVALEPDQALGARIRQAQLAGELPQHVEVRCGTIGDLDRAEQFDTILYVDVLEHIEDDAAELQRAIGHLAPGGFLVIVAPAHNWLYTPFDRAIGHYRRYDRSRLHAVMPSALRMTTCRYLDSVGALASIGNRLVLRSASPSIAQIRFWDRVLVPLSRLADPLLFWRVGKSLICAATADSSKQACA